MINEATANQNTWSSAALAKTSSYRRYTRKQKQYRNQQRHNNTYLEQEKALEEPIFASQSHFVAMPIVPKVNIRTLLPTRTEPPSNAFGDLVYSEPYYNPTTDKVEWVEKEMHGRYVLHRCDAEAWRASQRSEPV